MLETFYEQIREFGVQVDLHLSNKTDTVETYIVLGTQVDVYIIGGKPKTIIVSE